MDGTLRGGGGELVYRAWGRVGQLHHARGRWVERGYIPPRISRCGLVLIRWVCRGLLVRCISMGNVVRTAWYISILGHPRLFSILPCIRLMFFPHRLPTLTLRSLTAMIWAAYFI